MHGWKLKISAKQLDKVNINAMVALDQVGRKAFELMRQRVTERHTGLDDRTLPPYAVRVQKTGPMPASKPETHGKPWDKRRGIPPEILYEMRTKGGVFHAGKDWKGGEPVYYSPRSPRREKRGQLWGYRWPTREAFLGANRGGSQVDHKVTGDMWGKPKITAKAPKTGTMTLTVGFMGAVPRGGIYSIMKMLRERRREAIERGRKPRKVSAAVKAFFANQRDPDGKIKHHGNVPWLGLTDSEMDSTLEELRKQTLQKLDEIPVQVVVRS